MHCVAWVVVGNEGHIGNVAVLQWIKYEQTFMFFVQFVPHSNQDSARSKNVVISTMGMLMMNMFASENQYNINSEEYNDHIYQSFPSLKANYSWRFQDNREYTLITIRSTFTYIAILKYNVYLRIVIHWYLNQQ